MPKGSGGTSEIGTDGVPITGNVSGLITRAAILSALPGPTQTAIGKKRIDQLQNAMDRQACNQSGGFYTMGGQCLVGEAAKTQVDRILNNPDAPTVIKAKAEAYLERNDDNNDGQISLEESEDINETLIGAAVDIINAVDNSGLFGDTTADDTTLGDDLQTTSKTLEAVSYTHLRAHET